MLFAELLINDTVQALQAVALAAIAAYVAVRTRAIDARARDADRDREKESRRCDELEKRVKALEAKKRARRKPHGCD